MSSVMDVLDGAARWCVAEGDSLDVLRKLPDACVGAIITDPPYGIAHDSNWKGSEWCGQIIGDSSVSTVWLGDAFRVLKPGCAAYVFTRWDVEAAWSSALAMADFDVKQSIVWDRGTHGTGDLKGTYGPRHERVLFVTKGRHVLNGPRLPDVWRVPAVFTRAWRWHPHEKPIDLLGIPVLQSTQPDGLVLDPFCGSGSTVLAARKCGRRSIGVELDPKWAAMANARANGAERGDDEGAMLAKQLGLLGVPQ